MLIWNNRCVYVPYSIVHNFLNRNRVEKNSKIINVIWLKSVFFSNESKKLFPIFQINVELIVSFNSGSVFSWGNLSERKKRMSFWESWMAAEICSCVVQCSNRKYKYRAREGKNASKNVISDLLTHQVGYA